MSFDATSLAISPPLRRVFALALLLAAVTLIATGIVLPTVQRYRAVESGVVDGAAALARFRQAGAKLPRLAAEHDALKQLLASQSGFLKATSDPLTAAEMQSRIKSVIDREGGELKSTQILPARDEGGFRKVAARVEWVGSTEALARIWYAMESGAPFLFIDDFDIEGRPVPHKEKSAPPLIMLDVRFEVSAYARAAAP